MTDKHWDDLKSFINGGKLNYKPIGFIIDSPWLPGWNNISTIEYYSSDRLWWETNVKAIETFPDVWFLPGFWSEYGMCTEPSAFGARMVWPDQNLPYAEKVIESIDEVKKLPAPDVRTDGLLPFMINRLKTFEPQIIDMGHNIRFAISRGPLNIATFLMGTTEFMMALMMDPSQVHLLIRKLTDFIKDWLAYQKACFPSIEGVLILDDIIGFVGDIEFREFVLPYFKEIFSHLDLPVKCLHNDAKGLITAKYLDEIGANIFNYSFEHTNKEIFGLAGSGVTLLGNIPPRDVLAAGNEEDVIKAVKEQAIDTPENANIIWSCGGGMPPDVSNANIEAFINSVRET